MIPLLNCAVCLRCHLLVSRRLSGKVRCVDVWIKVGKVVLRDKYVVVFLGALSLV